MEEIIWTRHSKDKMRYYRLSENRLKRILRNPARKEIGIAPRTIAVMQRAGTKKHPTEIWLLYQKEKKKLNPVRKRRAQINHSKMSGLSNGVKIISAWRYPGRSPVREPPPIPEDILWQLTKEK